TSMRTIVGPCAETCASPPGMGSEAGGLDHDAPLPSNFGDHASRIFSARTTTSFGPDFAPSTRSRTRYALATRSAPHSPRANFARIGAPPPIDAPSATAAERTSTPLANVTYAMPSGSTTMRRVDGETAPLLVHVPTTQTSPFLHAELLPHTGGGAPPHAPR